MLERGLLELVRQERRFLPGESSRSQAPRCSSFHPSPVRTTIHYSEIGRLATACKSLTCARLCPRGQNCLYAPSTDYGPDVCDIRTSYVSRQCTSSDGDNVAPCLLRRLAAPYLLRGLATPYLLRDFACYPLPHGVTTNSLSPEETCCSLPPGGTSYSLSPEETCCFLPPGGTSYSLSPEET
ncbi:hypothetical protein Tco_0840695 [Tanacetum coccineum]|uniref:Uncharacterized protein n=1 Tax=Tanacetum coccineum TaxID=301880 RepID=A0ABQ5AV30_9ASTR